MGAKLVQEVASKTQDNAGDGTSTASILAQALCHTGLRNVTAGGSPVELKAGFDEAIEAVVERLKGMAEPVEDSIRKRASWNEAPVEDSTLCILTASIIRPSGYKPSGLSVKVSVVSYPVAEVTDRSYRDKAPPEVE